MPQISIVTDTDSSIPCDMAEKCGIFLVPIGINFEDETFIDGATIDNGRLFEMIDERNKLPTTSAPNPGAFVEAFEKAFSRGADSIICITVSSKVSSTYDSAKKARETFPERDIHVIDSYNLSMGQGYLALAASDAASKGSSVDEILTLLGETNGKLHTFAVLSTLKYLYLGGRVGKFQSRLADSFEIRPTLTVKDGKLEILEKNRTQSKAIKRLIGFIDEIEKNNKIKRMAVIHVCDPSGAESLKMTLREIVDSPEKIEIFNVNPGLSVHTGKGLIGIVLETH